MVTIGGKTKKVKPTKPQFVVQLASHINEYMLFKTDHAGQLNITWIGDPNAATKFDSKYAAKHRVRELLDVPETRCFRQLGA